MSCDGAPRVNESILIKPVNDRRRSGKKTFAPLPVANQALTICDWAVGGLRKFFGLTPRIETVTLSFVLKTSGSSAVVPNRDTDLWHTGERRVPQPPNSLTGLAQATGRGREAGAVVGCPAICSHQDDAAAGAATWRPGFSRFVSTFFWREQLNASKPSRPECAPRRRRNRGIRLQEPATSTSGHGWPAIHDRDLLGVAESGHLPHSGSGAAGA